MDVVPEIVSAYNNTHDEGGSPICTEDVVRTKDGQGWQISSAFKEAKALGINTRDWATTYAEGMSVEGCEVTVVGPGFIEVRPSLRQKCTASYFCHTLDQFLQLDNRKGFRVLSYVNVQDFSAPSVLRPAYYPRATSSGGVLLSYCPFCGAFLQSGVTHV